MSITVNFDEHSRIGGTTGGNSDTVEMGICLPVTLQQTSSNLHSEQEFYLQKNLFEFGNL